LTIHIISYRCPWQNGWRHSGFSVHNTVHVPPGDHSGVEALIRYMMRPPVSLARLRLRPGSDEVLHFPG
jgi:hypothetical protein